METFPLSRRRFIGKTAAVSGSAALGSQALQGKTSDNGSVALRLPREVWIATVSQMGLRTDTAAQMIETVFRILDKALLYRPDILCLPEVFTDSNIGEKLSLPQKVEVSEMAVKRTSDFCRQNRCYLICPVYTSEKGKIYNSAVVFDRRGEKLGEYRKMHPTRGEIREGLTPGPLDPPVFLTDFGTIGIQICFDVIWDDGWQALRKKGAEIVFWPSAYAGGKVLNAKAWQNKYVVVSSTRKNTSKICDVDGEVIAQTGIWDPHLTCAPVNLEKAFLHIWPYVNRFDEIRKKYGRKVRITNHHEEEWSILESLSPEVKIKDVLKEFDLKTLEQHRQDAEDVQREARNQS